MRKRFGAAFWRVVSLGGKTYIVQCEGNVDICITINLHDLNSLIVVATHIDGPAHTVLLS